MAIDFKSRQILMDRQSNKSLTDGLKEAFGAMADRQAAPSLVIRHEEDQKLQVSIDKISQAIAKLYSQIKVPLSLPKIFNIEGQVGVTDLPPVKIKNFSDLDKSFVRLEARIAQLTQAISNIPRQEIKFPEIKFPKTTIDLSGVESRLEELAAKPTSGGSEDVVDALYQVRQVLEDLAARPSMSAPPATHFSLNALNGTFHATTLNVTSAATALPATALAARRSLIIYNNSANTIYLGDKNVATSGTGQGLPIPTLTYSPPIDTGPNMTLYGIASSPSSVSVLEVSDENSGR